jgi:hypothetical protein
MAAGEGEKKESGRRRVGGVYKARHVNFSDDVTVVDEDVVNW